MGGSSYSDDFYKDRVADRAARGVPTFSHDHDVNTGKVKKAVHDALNILGKVRESRDSAAHPQSLPCAIFCDVTGSMRDVPTIIQAKIPQLMGLLLRKGFVQDPQILFGAVGDYFADKVPLQVGQFESGVEMDDDITKVVLEGGGGGTYQESYQNALYFCAYRTRTDAWEKRGKKGYLFLIGDEKAYPRAIKEELDTLIGDGAQGDASLASIVAAANERWNTFFIIPKGTQHFDDPALKAFWADLFGAERVILLDDPSAICETIGTAIGLCEGTTTADAMASDLADVGASSAIVASTAKGLDALAKSTALAPLGHGTLPEKADRSNTIERL
jgi:hypothetical protein